MTLPAQGTRLFEIRVFVVIMAFSIVSGVNAAFAPYLSLLLLQKFGLSSMELGFVSVLLSGLQYLLSPVLFFIVLYLTCGGPLLDRIASVLLSLVFGSLVGYPIGGFTGSLAVNFLFGRQIMLYYQPVLSLPQHVVAQTLMGFAVLAFSDINLRWRSALPFEEVQKSRPAGVTLLAALYVVFAFLNAGAMPALALYPSIIGYWPIAALVFIAYGVVLGMIVAGQLAVAAGLYYGKKWGWIIAVISSASSLVMGVFTFGAMIVLGNSRNTLMLMLMSFVFIVGLMINLAVLLYLLRIDIRKFFGFINPPSQI